MSLGSIDEDLRFIGVYGDEPCTEEINSCISEIDANFDFNGDHEFYRATLNLKSSNNTDPNGYVKCKAKLE